MLDELHMGSAAQHPSAELKHSIARTNPLYAPMQARSWTSCIWALPLQHPDTLSLCRPQQRLVHPDTFVLPLQHPDTPPPCHCSNIFSTLTPNQHLRSAAAATSSSFMSCLPLIITPTASHLLTLELYSPRFLRYNKRRYLHSSPP